MCAKITSACSGTVSLNVSGAIACDFSNPNRTLESLLNQASKVANQPGYIHFDNYTGNVVKS
jgi:hypothetical protein